MLFLETINHNFMDAEDIAKNFFTMNRNEAIEIVKKNWPNNDSTQFREALETLIPELRVNEDERIRTRLIALVEAFGQGKYKDEMLAYLERQKQHKPIFKVGDTIKPKAYNESHRIDKIKDDNYVLDNGFTFPIVGQDVWEIVQQKPAELPKSEDYGIDGLYAALDILQKTLGEVEGYQTDDGILEHKCAISAVKELYEQQPAEWSEDKEIREEVIGDLCALKDWIIKYDANWLANPVLKNIDKRISWLKAIRPQPHTIPVETAAKFGSIEYERGVKDGIQSEKSRQWKPSEEQESVAEKFARMVRENLIGIDKEVQQKFEQLYFEITGNKMYGGYND